MRSPDSGTRGEPTAVTRGSYPADNVVPLLVERVGEAAGNQALRETPLRVVARP